MPEAAHPVPSPSLFAEQPPERSFPVAAVAIAALLLVVLAAAAVLLGHRHTGGSGNLAYAPHLQLGDLRMSESESLSGGKSTYIDGRITNLGTEQ